MRFFFFVSYLFTLCPFTTGMHAQISLKFDVFFEDEYLFVSQRSESETLFSTRNILGTGR